MVNFYDEEEKENYLAEKMALELCYNEGFNWDEDGIELYSILDRVSCQCCRNKSLKELANYKKIFTKIF